METTAHYGEAVIVGGYSNDHQPMPDYGKYVFTPNVGIFETEEFSTDTEEQMTRRLFNLFGLFDYVGIDNNQWVVENSTCVLGLLTLIGEDYF